jgi:hypothetical protein
MSDPKALNIPTIEEWRAVHEAMFNEEAAKQSTPLKTATVLAIKDLSRRLVDLDEELQAHEPEQADRLVYGMRAVASALGTYLGALVGNDAISDAMSILVEPLLQAMGEVAARAEVQTREVRPHGDAS